MRAISIETTSLTPVSHNEFEFPGFFPDTNGRASPNHQTWGKFGRGFSHWSFSIGNLIPAPQVRTPPPKAESP